MKVVLQGNSINRLYRVAKAKRNETLFTAGASFTLAALDAHRKDVPFMFVFGALTCMGLNIAKKYIDAMKLIKPEYDKIVERAKHIKAAQKK